MLLIADRQIYETTHAYERKGDADFWTLEITYSGKMLRRSGEMTDFQVQPNNTLLLTPPGIRYGLRGKERGEEIWFMFRPSSDLESCLNLPCASFAIPEIPIPRTQLGRQVIQALENVHYHKTTPHIHSERLAENALECLLLLTAQLAAEAQQAVDSRIRTVQRMIEEKYTQSLTVDQLAKEIHLSPSRFAHLFRDETGMSPIQYLEKVRLEQAQLLLLRTDLQIQEIASQVGFDCPFYFSTRFRRTFGCSPKTWRNQPSFSPTTGGSRPD